MVDSIVEVLDAVVGDHVARAVHLHAVLGEKRLRKTRQVLPCASDPSHQPRRIVTADEDVVGDVEVTRSAPIGEDAASDVFDPGILQRESDGADDAFAPE